ncbi:hypothetical protein SESBI_21995 [Sesbania bispinosa]|nr:hypothetical protein SESBI_21995 [Sesbania bispinosa]
MKSKQPRTASSSSLSPSSLHPPPPILDTAPCASRFTSDISGMPNNRIRNTGHRRAQFEILTLPDNINIDADLYTIGDLSFSYGTTKEDLLPAYLDVDNINPSSQAPGCANNIDIAIGSTGTNESLKVGNERSLSMNGSTSIIKPNMLFSSYLNDSTINSRKGMSALKLEELALVDSNRAKRLSAKNSELRLQISSMQQHIQLQRAFNNAVKEEIQHLKVMTGEAIMGGGPMNFAAFGRGQQYYPNNQAMHALFAERQLQQLQNHSQRLKQKLR